MRSRLPGVFPASRRVADDASHGGALLAQVPRVVEDAFGARAELDLDQAVSSRDSIPGDGAGAPVMLGVPLNLERNKGVTSGENAKESGVSRLNLGPFGF